MAHAQNLMAVKETEVTGTQIINPPDTYWTNENWATTASFVATLFGTGLTIILWLYDKHKDGKGKENAAKAATQRIQQGVHDAENGVEMALLNRRSSRADPATFPPSVERKVRERVNRDIEQNLPAQQVRQDAQDEAKAEIENFVGRDVVETANRSNAEAAVGRELHALETTPYIENFVSAQTERNNAARARSRETEAQAQVSILQRQIHEEETRREEVQR